MRVVCVALVVALIFAFVDSSSAGLLYDISSSGEGSSYAGYAGNWGLEFTVTQSTFANALGVWNEGSDPLPSSIQVGLWNESTGNQLIASTTLTNSSTVVASSASDIGQWLFNNLPGPVALPAGDLYILGFFNDDPSVNTGIGLIPFRGGATATFLSGTSFTTGEAGSNQRASLTVPDAGQGGPADNWFGPNLSTTVVAVPEPASLSLAALGILGLAGYGLHRRRVDGARPRADGVGPSDLPDQRQHRPADRLGELGPGGDDLGQVGVDGWK
jgi:MYXO-CTERM domain-containing protein